MVSYRGVNLLPMPQEILSLGFLHNDFDFLGNC